MSKSNTILNDVDEKTDIIHIVMSCYKREFNLNKIIDSLEKQTICKKIHFHILNNNISYKKILDKQILSTNVPFKINILHYDNSHLWFERYFYIRDVIIEKYKAQFVIIINDDQTFRSNWVQKMYSVRELKTFKSWNCKKYDYNCDHTKNLKIGETFNYGFPGGSIIDTSIFKKDSEFWDIPTNLPDGLNMYIFDDYWLSYVISHIYKNHGWTIQRYNTNDYSFKPYTIKDKKSLNASSNKYLNKKKKIIFKYLRDTKGWFDNVVKQQHVKTIDLKNFVMIITSYNNNKWYLKNLDSIINQTYKNWRIVYIDDCSTDNTYNLVKEYIRNKKIENKVTLIRNESNMKQSYGRYIAFKECDDDEICCLLDGDDWLYDNNVLSKLNEIYNSTDCMVTYSDYIKYYKGKLVKRIRGQDYNDDVKNNCMYRNSKWLCNPLRTGYSRLFKNVNEEEMKDQNGDWLKCSTDMALMYSVMEQSNGKIRVINDVMYVYNIDNSLQYNSSFYNNNVEFKKYREELNIHIKYKYFSTSQQFFKRYLEENNILMIKLSKSLNKFSRICHMFNLMDFNNINKPCLFFGVYNMNELNSIINHQGPKYVMFGGTDCDDRLNIHKKFLNKLKDCNDIKFISISKNISETLKKYNIKFEEIPLDLTNYNIFKPINNLGNCIYIYNGSGKITEEKKIIYNHDMLNKIKKMLPQYEYIHSNELNVPYNEIAEIYKKCFIGLRLTTKDGNANTVQEFECMNIPIVHNLSEYGLKWKNVDDIVNHIKNQADKIKNQKTTKEFLIFSHSCLSNTAGDTIMVSNYINRYLNDNYNVTLLSRFDINDVFLRNIYNKNKLQTITIKTNEEVIKYIDNNYKTIDSILIRDQILSELIKNKEWLNKTIIYGLDVHLHGIKGLNNKYKELWTQSDKLKQLFIENGVQENKIKITEPIAWKYDFELPERNDDEIRLIYCGTLRDEENILEILEEFQKIHKERPEVLLKIVYGKIVGNKEFVNKVNTYIREGVDGCVFKYNLSHRDACYEIATSDIGICWRKNGWGENGEVSTKVKEYDMYGLEIINDMKIKVGVVTSTNKLDKIDNIINNFKQQIYFNKKLFIVINNNKIDAEFFHDRCKEAEINYEIIIIDESYNLGYCLNKSIELMKQQKYDIFSKFDDDDIYEKKYLLEQVYYLNKTKCDIVGKYDTIIYCIDKNKFYKIQNFDIQNKFTNFCRGSTITFNINILNDNFDEIQTTGVDTIFIKKKNIYCTSNKNYILVRYDNYNKHTWKINFYKEFILKEINYSSINYKYFNGIYLIKNLSSNKKKCLHNDNFRTEYVTNPMIMEYTGYLYYDNLCLVITPIKINSKVNKSDYGIITSSNKNSGLIYETNYFIKYINKKSDIIPEVFYFPTSSGRDIDINYERNYISSINKEIKIIYNKGIQLKNFIRNKKTILIYEIFSLKLFNFILEQNIKLIFIINSDCLINWDNKKNRNIDWIMNAIYNLKFKYNNNFVICVKNIETLDSIKNYSIETTYIPTFIGTDLITYECFKNKYTNKKIEVSIVLGAGYQKGHRKSIELYLDILYDIINNHQNIVFNIFTPNEIEYNINNFPNLFIHVNKSDIEVNNALLKTQIAFYFSKYDGLALTPLQLLCNGCYTISIFNDSFDIFDCYNMKLYIDTILDGKKQLANIYKVKNIFQIKEKFKEALQIINSLKINDLVKYYNNIVDIYSFKTLSLSLLLKEYIEPKICNDNILCSLTTYPLKKYTCLYNIENIILKCDKINIYLNEYSNIPKLFKLLNKTSLFNIELCIDNKALSKFNIFKYYKKHCFIFTIDDDLYYPFNYIDNMINKYNEIKKYITKDLVISSVGRIFNNTKIKRYESPTQIIKINNDGKSIFKNFQIQNYKDEFVDLVGTGNALFYNTKLLNEIINSIFDCNISFKTISLDETFAIKTMNKNIVKICSSMNNNDIFFRYITNKLYINYNINGLHEFKNNNSNIISEIESCLKKTNFLELNDYRNDTEINMLLVGWNNINAHPVNILTTLFEKLNYKIHFYGLKLEKITKSNSDIKNSINKCIKEKNINVVFWFNWKFDINELTCVVNCNNNIKHVMFNWDPVDINLNPSYKKYFDLFDFTFISQELDYSYTKDKYKIYYPGFDYKIKNEIEESLDNYYGDVCFVITNYYDNRAELINMLINNNISVHIYGPEKLKYKFPENYKYNLIKNEVYDIYNHYKISINLTINTTAKEYINERVSEIFYSKGLMVTNLENTILKNNYNCFTFKTFIECVKIVKNILFLYKTNIKKINMIKEQAYNTSIEILDYRKSILKMHIEILKVINKKNNYLRYDATPPM